ncbi:MAG TPA: putative ABC exporter domain-containing protein [Gemmatimonadales bacterium]|nr:putative ABC exporter domain-containing protein [Gemmatimonadales bacterium]
MVRAVAYLALTSARNRAALLARRLRRPRYLLALVAAALYLWFFLVGGGRPEQLIGGRPAWLETGLAALFLGAALWAWLAGAERRALAFEPAEVQFLFPAPVARAALIHYKLLRAQLLILLNALFWAVFLSREAFGVSAWRRGLAVWLALSTLQMHRLGASLTRASLREPGAAGWKRHPVILPVVGGTILAVLVTILAALPELQRAAREGIDSLGRAALVMSDAPALRTALAPFRLLARPLLALAAPEWWRALLPALAVLLVHYVWVVRADASFEEAAVEASFARARRVDRRRGASMLVDASAAGVGPPVTRLAPTGWPAAALFWKNVTALLRRRRLALLVIGIAAGAAALGAVSVALAGGLVETLGSALVVWAVFGVLMGPQWIRNDLRGDLGHLAVLRTYPLRGRDVVAAEVAASALLLSLLHLAVLTLAWCALLGSTDYSPGPEMRTRLLLGAALVLPAVNVLALLVHNAAALLYPEWVHLGPARAGRFEALGQAMIVAIAVALVVAVLLAPAAAIGAGIHLAVGLVGRRAETAAWFLGGAGALATAAVETWWLVGWLGRVFERTEPEGAETAGG